MRSWLRPACRRLSRDETSRTSCPPLGGPSRGHACYHRAASGQEGVTIESQVVGTTTILRVRGTLRTNADERGLREVIRDAVADGVRTVVLNLEDAIGIDSSGVSDLASGHMLLAGHGGALKLCCLSKKLQDVFVVTRLNAVFETYETEAAALASAAPK